MAAKKRRPGPVLPKVIAVVEDAKNMLTNVQKRVERGEMTEEEALDAVVKLAGVLSGKAKVKS
jgi:hypothetical protein